MYIMNVSLVYLIQSREYTTEQVKLADADWAPLKLTTLDASCLWNNYREISEGQRKAHD